MKRRFFTSLLIISLFSLPILTQAQVKVSNHDDYFGGGSGSASDENNVVKVGFFHLFNGELPIYWEHRINNNFTVQGAAGITFLDFLMMMGDAINSDNGNGGSYTPPTFSMGYTLKLGAKFYPSGEAPEGFYLAPEIRYKVYNYAYNNSTLGFDTFNNPITGNLNGKTSYFDFLGTIGYQFIGENNFAFDMYTGFGGRVRNRDILSSATDARGNAYDVWAKQTGLVPFFSIGFTLGAAF